MSDTFSKVEFPKEFGDAFVRARETRTLFWAEQCLRSTFAEIVLPNPSSVRLHEWAGFKFLGVHHDIGFKLGRWHDIGYWRMGVAATHAAPREPIPFPELRNTSDFAAGASVRGRATDSDVEQPRR